MNDQSQLARNLESITATAQSLRLRAKEGKRAERDGPERKRGLEEAIAYSEEAKRKLRQALEAI